MADESVSKWSSVHELILDTTYEIATFFNAAKIWIERPQVLNRRLSGSCILQAFETTKRAELLFSIFALSKKNDHIPRDYLQQLQRKFEVVSTGSTTAEENVLEVKIRTLFPRQSSKYNNISEVIIQDNQDKNNGTVMFIPFEEDERNDGIFPKLELAYQLSLCYNTNNCQSLCLSVLRERKTGDGITCPTVEWLKSQLLMKVQKWMQAHGKLSNSFGPSLSLVPVNRYAQKYEELKRKYKHFVKMWPERTDPHKFVYEDVAIATYLLLLWEGEQQNRGHMGKVETFVDLGCGNGLLVHILANEGHRGKGIDLRARKVWKFFDEKTDLQVSTLDPSCLTFSDVDWIIGNHSDELTPWIPVISARSSYNCKYFVLPCCFYDFYCKRESSQESQYRCYLSHVRDIGKTCGFEVKQDVLRIPSTKKVCQIGRVRNYLVTEQDAVNSEITKMLQNARYRSTKEENLTEFLKASHSAVNSPSHEESSPNSSAWDFGTRETSSAGAEKVKTFLPRAEVEVVKNCTQLDKELLESIVQTVAAELLSRSEHQTILQLRRTDGLKTWNQGGRMKLDEVSMLFDQKVLKELRSEAGGLQTVLRNSHQVFKVCNGAVEIRNWQQESHAALGRCKNKRKEDATRRYWKTKQCWFHVNHPDGCPLLAPECSFAHGIEDVSVSKVHESSDVTIC